MNPNRLFVVTHLIGVGLIAALTLVGFNTKDLSSQHTHLTPQTTVAPTAAVVAVPTGSSVLGVFEGITPCSNVTKPLSQISTQCEQMIWKLTLYQDPNMMTPTTYKLHSAYGFPQQGTTGLSGGGTKVGMEGMWAIIRGTKTDPNAVVYQLNPENQQASVYFLRLDKHILHVLYRDKSLMVGNAAWSYTLNRTDPKTDPNQTSSQDTRHLFQAKTPRLVRNGSAFLGVFDGRVPCGEIALEFTGIPADPSCQKIKWRLTLYQDPKTGAPTTYKFLGTRTTREGHWTIVRGTKADPDTVVYQLQLDLQLNLGNPQAAVYFLKADDNNLLLLDREGNLLVGDALWSYTLSRADDTF